MINMTGHAGTRPRGMTPHKRDFDTMQNSAIDDELAKEPWNALKPEEVTNMAHAICDKLRTPLVKYASLNQRFQDVVNAVEAKRKLAEIRYFNVAVLGEQGIGKSTVINALLD